MCAPRPRGRRGAEQVFADAARPDVGNPALVVAAAAAAAVTAAVGRGHSRPPAVVGMRGERGAGGWGERRGSTAMAATAFTAADLAVARRVSAPAFGGSLVVRGGAVEKGVCGRRGIRRPLAIGGARESGWRCRGAAWRVRGPLSGLFSRPSHLFL